MREDRFPEGRGMRTRLLLIVIALAGLGLYWFFNQKPVGYTERRQVLTTSVSQENELGAQAYAQILSEAGSSVICSNLSRQCAPAQENLVDVVREIGDDLRRAAIAYERELIAAGYPVEPKAESFDWTFNVIQSDQPNAFCLPGGYVAVYTGMLDVTGNFDGQGGGAPPGGGKGGGAFFRGGFPPPPYS
ncbi:MAG TPA: hypothetical protein DDY27_06320 [Hyphomonadaceae bacterium]|nr:hypothetical protein [Hyphomonadaceae bacterium]